MGAAVIVKKDEKVNAVLDAMADITSVEEFKAKFKTMYPKEWENVKRRYAEHESRDKKGKGHPMPHPEKYLENMYKNAIKKKTSKES